MTHKIVIVGGGFAGAYAAKYLRARLGRRATIELLNDTNYFVFQPLLPEVASGIISAPDAVAPLRQLLPGIKVRLGHALSVNLAERRVMLLQGRHRVVQSSSYDHLVLAPGRKASLDAYPGAFEHGLTMRNLADAHTLRNQVIQCLEHADITENTALKTRLLTFIVAGGGFSGIEVAGELWDMLLRALVLYPNVARDELRLIVLQRGSRILPELPESLGRYAEGKLKRRGIEFKYLGLRSASEYAVTLEDGSRIGTATLIMTIGNGPCELSQRLDVKLEHGRIPTDEYLRVKGVERVWALGDAAAIPLPDERAAGRAPPTAQFAVQEAKSLARNLEATLAGRSLQPFDYKPRGSLASIGHYSAVAEVFGVRISGLVAWFMWRGFYILRLPGFTTKLRVTLNWLFDYLLPRNLVQIRNERPGGSRYVHYACGEILFHHGELVDGIYAVVRGLLEYSVVDPDTGEESVSELGSGEHWGEALLVAGRAADGQLRAVEDTCLLFLPRQDFERLRTAFGNRGQNIILP